jgi:hypothetical protein
MMIIFLHFFLFKIAQQRSPQIQRPKVTVEKIRISYKGKMVAARKLVVRSVIPIDITLAWENVQTPKLLQFVAKGMISFQSTDGGFPKKWKQGETYGVKMWIFGWVPFGGTHYLHIKDIDPDNFTIATEEWDNSAKVWNHNIVLEDMGNGSIQYEDAIIIYGGILTGFITSFAKRFYVHRQKRWQFIARAELEV